MRIGFVGGGHMTTALVGGVLRHGAPVDSVRVADPVPAQLERLAYEFGVRGTTDNLEAVRDADLVVLAVKPQDMAAAAQGIATVLAERRRVVVSVAAGESVWLDDESQMDAATAISGSGPAYFFLLVEALEAAGIELGLPHDTARRLAAETARGAGRMAAESGLEPATLREQVTSKGGTTAAALAVLEAADLRGIVGRAAAAAARRSAELAAQSGGR